MLNLQLRRVALTVAGARRARLLVEAILGISLAYA